jgi:N-acetyl-gamma-glutamyl-phosphate reductase
MIKSSKPKVFIDGQVGTTGLMINERLNDRKDIEILTIDRGKRKDSTEKKKILNQADLVFLCLPDEAAKESVSLIENETTRVIDASTAHRTHAGWSYGLPELFPGKREEIKNARFVSNPGCHATGFISVMAPLVSAGIVSPDLSLTCQSLSGYSGAGKTLIEKYSDPLTSKDFKEGPHHYALGLTHKHIPEMKRQSGLNRAPLFTPMVGPFFKGMVVTIPLFIEDLKGVNHGQDIQRVLYDHYINEEYINVLPFDYQDDLIDGVFFHPQGCNDTNRLDIFVYANDCQAVILCRLDNLGKGASGAAIQNMNIMLGFKESCGLKSGIVG